MEISTWMGCCVSLVAHFIEWIIKKPMAVVSVSKAARLVGVSRATLLQVIDSGKLQAVDMEEGRRGVDTGDLERMYGFLLPDSVADTTVLDTLQPLKPLHQEPEAVQNEMRRLRQRVEQAREQENEEPAGRRTGLVLSFAGMLAVMVAVAVVYRFLPHPPQSAPEMVNALPSPEPMDLPVTQPNPAAPDSPPPVAPSDTETSYIDSVVVEETTPPAPEPGSVDSQPAPTPLPETREVVAAVLPTAPSAPASTVVETPDEIATPEVAEPSVPTAPPRSELGQFMDGLDSGEYVVVVGSFSSEESAIQGRDRLRVKHPELFQPDVQMTAGNTEKYENYYKSGKYWVVYVGDFYARESAERLRGKAVNELGMREDSFLQRPR